MTTILPQEVQRLVATHPFCEASFHEGEIPALVESELERLYQNPMTTLARFAIYEAAPNASTYIERIVGEIVTVLLFRRERHHLTVYNEQVALPAASISRFARAVYARYPSVYRIDFYAIATDGAAIAYPFLQHECLEDIVLSLPPSPDDYLAMLGKNTRSEIKRYLGKIRRDFPSFRFDVFPARACVKRTSAKSSRSTTQEWKRKSSSPITTTAASSACCA
jgi:hypothetical protein